ncbi:MAG: hypothetical protein G3W66_19880 [Xanthomonas perforans]|nr:hypothetical protein [Xanthomonas perforans]
MNKTLVEMIAVMQAAERGELIEVAHQRRGDWVPDSTPSWDWVCYDYRVKPQPKIIWVNEYSRDSVAHLTEDDAKAGVGSGVIRTAIKYVEAQD